MKKKSVLIVGPFRSTFTRNDAELFSQSGWHVRKLDADIGRGLRGLMALVKSVFVAIPRVWSSDCVFCWFADYATLAPALLARLFGKRVLVVACGFDVTNMPEYNTGAILKPARWFFTRNTFKLATKIFPVSDFAKRCLVELLPDAVHKAVTVHNCIFFDRFATAGCVSKREIALTVNQADNLNDYRIKGMPEFIELASRMPHVRFVLAGLRSVALREAQRAGGSLPNLSIIPGPLSQKVELIPLFYSAHTYCQPSHFESFGLAVAEAMACGCVPCTSNNGAIPEIVTSEGYRGDSYSDWMSIIEKATSASDEERSQIRNSVRRFDVEARRAKLLREME